jgi:hypothetical protein
MGSDRPLAAVATAGQLPVAGRNRGRRVYVSFARPRVRLLTSVAATSSAARCSETILLIENATAELHAARQRDLRDQVERRRMHRLVEEIDHVIESCEETHLQRIKQITPSIARAYAQALEHAHDAVADIGDPEAERSMESISRIQPRRIVHIMDAMWSVQEVLFDLMQPSRQRLPEDSEDEQARQGSWRPAA